MFKWFNRKTTESVAEPEAPKAVIDIRDITRTYEMGEFSLQVLKGISLEIFKGEFVSIMGPSGSGKSTLMNILGALDQPTSGEYSLDGVDVSKLGETALAGVRNKKIGFVFQSFNLLRRTTALRQVELPLVYGGVSGRSQKAKAALESVGLGQRLDHLPSELSGGQQQRVAIARALVNEPAMILADEPTGNLDSRSGTEVMPQIFQQLNRDQGITIVFVTHDPWIARHTKRVVMLRDGKIVADRQVAAPLVAGETERPSEAEELEGVFKEAYYGGAKAEYTLIMNLIESFRIAVNSLMINRLVILTTLGILIGVGAVVGLTSLGRGVENYVSGQFTSLGANTLTVSSTRPSSGTRTVIQPLTDKEAIAIARLPGVQRVATQYNVSGTLLAGTESVSISLNGVSANYVDVNEWRPRNDGGRFISQQDINDSARVVVLGESTVEDLYGDPNFNPINLSLQINGRIFTVIGVMENRPGGAGADQNAAAFVPISTAQSRLDNARVRGGAYKVSQMQVQVESKNAIEMSMQAIEVYLASAHDIIYSGDEDFRVSNQGDLLSSITQVTGILTLFLAGVSGISLLVGGIGIMNIMLVSVTERTREIGLRKAVGARGLDILSQFLIESILLSLIGGALGIVLGWLISLIGGALVPDLDLSLTLDSVLLATGISSFVGVFFGLYPANRAARMRPIEALRFE